MIDEILLFLAKKVGHAGGGGEHIYIYIYISVVPPPPRMDPGLVCLTCIFQCFMPLFASWICVKIWGCHIHIRYACMQTDAINTMTSASAI